MPIFKVSDKSEAYILVKTPYSNSFPASLPEQIFKTVADTATDAILITDQSSQIIYCNRKACEIFEFESEAELIGKNLALLMPEKYREGHEKGVARFLQTGIPKLIGHTVQVEGIRNSGEVFPLELSLSFWKENNTYFFTGIIRDITHRLELEKETKESTEKFKLLAENSTDVIARHTPESIYIYISPSCEQVFGYKPEELIGKNPYAYIHPEDVARVQAEHKKVLETPDLSTIEVRFLCKDGQYKWIEVTGKNIRDPKTHKVVEIQTSAREVTERKRKEDELNEAYEEVQVMNEELQAMNEELNAMNEELHAAEDQLLSLNANLEEKVEEKTRQVLKRSQALMESENRFQLLVNSVKDYAIFMISPEGYISSWNPGAKNLIGYLKEEIIGRHFSIFYPEEIKNDYPAYELQKAVEIGRFEDEGWRIRKDGSRMWANVIITPMYDKSKKLIGFSKVTRDLTERKAAEDLLRRINEDLDNFIYTASHDLKAPISNLEGLLNAAFDDIQKECSGSVKDIFRMMNSSVARLKVIISELTEISQIQKSTLDDLDKVELNDLLEEFQTSHNTEIVKSNTSFFTDFEIKEIHFSRKNLRSIFNNIVSNAIKYRSPDRDPQILLRSYKQGEFIVLEFQDNGVGFEVKYKEKVFGMFKRLHDHVEGTGVGLYIVKRIVENTGGKIEVDSEVGKGSTFKVYIPVL